MRLTALVRRAQFRGIGRFAISFSQQLFYRVSLFFFEQPPTGLSRFYYIIIFDVFTDMVNGFIDIISYQ